MNNNEQNKQIGFWKKHSFIFLFLSAILIREIPYVSTPFKWLETFFHEISHGLAAIITGGSIKHIEIMYDGSGVCTTIGGIAFIISFMGYAGATFWGWGIYKVAESSEKLSKLFLYALTALLIVSLILWTRTILTASVITLLIAICGMACFLNNLKYIQIFLKLTGLTILLNSLASPFYLIDGQSLGDGSSLAERTHIPEFIWIATWAGIALFACYSLAKTRKSDTY